MDIKDVAAARTAMLKVRKQAKKAAAAQYKLNRLHTELGQKVMEATKYYESVADAYLASQLKESGYD